jgi:hypothetical protein
MAKKIQDDEMILAGIIRIGRIILSFETLILVIYSAGRVQDESL